MMKHAIIWTGAIVWLSLLLAIWKGGWKKA